MGASKWSNNIGVAKKGDFQCFRDNAKKWSSIIILHFTNPNIDATESSLMPGFHPSVAVLPLPFRRAAVPLCRSVAVVPFRSVALPLPLRVRTELLETSFRWRHLNNDQNAEWLSSNGRTAKIGFDSICYGTAVTAQRQLEWQRHNGIFHVCNVIQTNSYGAYGIFLTATAKRQRQNGNGRVETRH